MPKLVDHRERRTLIADALMRVAATRGLEAVSLRHVATEAGVSAGMVQHYFRTKDEMMTFAIEVVTERVQERLGADLARHGADPPVTVLVRAFFVQLLPMDEPRRVEGLVALAFLAYAAARPDVAERQRATAEELRTSVAEQIRAAQETGEVQPAGDPTQIAMTLLALVEGLGMQVLAGELTAQAALTVFDGQLDLLLGDRTP